MPFSWGCQSIRFEKLASDLSSRYYCHPSIQMPLDGLFTILDDSLIVFFPRVEAHSRILDNDARDCDLLAMEGYRSQRDAL